MANCEFAHQAENSDVVCLARTSLEGGSRLSACVLCPLQGYTPCAVRDIIFTDSSYDRKAGKWHIPQGRKRNELREKVNRASFAMHNKSGVVWERIEI